MDAIPPAGAEPATRELLTAAGGERCASCQTPLASDQRYCVACGARRGKTRFSFEALAGQAAPTPAPAKPPRRPRASASTTLVAGVATLLLAMGLGVLIGQNGNNTAKPTAAAAAPQVIKIDAGGRGGRSTRARKAAARTAGLGAFKAPKVTVSKKLAAAATAAANKVLGAAANNLAPVTVQPGQACAHGAGCQNGKFTGNFFAP